MPLLAKQWDEIYRNRDFPVFSDLILQEIANSYSLKGSALDIGCGTGNLASRLANQGLSVTGVDLSEFAISKARTAYPKVHFEAINVFDFDGQFDVIFTKLVYALMPDRPAFLTKIQSLLKPHGLVVLSTPVRFSNYEYDAHYTSISVEPISLKDDLMAFFPRVNLIDTSYQGFAEGVQTLVCTS